MSYLLISSEIRLVGEVEGEEEAVVVVVGSIDVSHEALWWVFYWFLTKFANEKELVTDGPTEPFIEMRGRI